MSSFSFLRIFGQTPRKATEQQLKGPEEQRSNPSWTDEQDQQDGVLTTILRDSPSPVAHVGSNSVISSNSSFPGPAEHDYISETDSQGRQKKGDRGLKRPFLADLRSRLVRKSVASAPAALSGTGAVAVTGFAVADTTASTPQRGEVARTARPHVGSRAAPATNKSSGSPSQRRVLQRRPPANTYPLPKRSWTRKAAKAADHTFQTQDQPPYEAGALRSLSLSPATLQPLQSPRSTASNTNKPLPSPPSLNGQQSGKGAEEALPGARTGRGRGTAAGEIDRNVSAKSRVKPTLELQRIMPPLKGEHVEKLFSGAPQFFARSEGHFTGAPHPSVAFPWDEEVAIRDLTDHIQIEDEAWGCCTAWPHITHAYPYDSSTRRHSHRSIRAHFYPRCRERPNMLSMAGLEKGSMGYQAALEQAVGDALQDEQWGFESLAARPRPIIEQRQRMLSAKGGLRHLDEESILDLLIINGRRYAERHLRKRRTSSDLYMELYVHILYPPDHLTSRHDPYSLTTQIQSLVSVLATPNAWIDFSQVAWRIRLGRLLWGLPEDELDSEGDGSSTRSTKTGDESAAELQEERYWLLLQILLACELLIRLDILTEGDETGTENIKASEIHRFEKDTTVPVKWSMILARAWLENIEIDKTEGIDVSTETKPKGWLATLTKRMSMVYDQPQTLVHRTNYAIRGKHSQRQVNGLKHFARVLKWPDIESHTGRISDNCRTVIEGAPAIVTPLASPMSRAGSVQSSYFDGARFGGYKDETRVKRTPSKRRQISAALHPSGWLSKSYVSGFMLPGEGLTHFLMATLLENDGDAMTRLGPMANLCGGFVYRQKSFWSTACIVGRVLAAGKGSAECMGWISSDIVPRGFADGWLNVVVADIPSDVQLVNKKARLWGKTLIEKQSHVLGDADPSSILAGDFIVPSENMYRETPVPTGIRIELRDLDLGDPIASTALTPAVDDITPFTETSQLPPLLSHEAKVTFTVVHDEMHELMDYTFSLSKDIYFVTAHPCVPSQHVKILNSSSSPTIRSVDMDGAGPGRTANAVGHPLHKFYTYMPMHLTELLANQHLTLEEILAKYKDAKHRPSLAPSPASVAKVLVIDCITGFQPGPQEHEIPLSPVVSRSSTQSQADTASWDMTDGYGTTLGSAATAGGKGSSAAQLAVEPASKNMHQETRRRQFGSDMEILVRALCAQKGWNALISRRRRGCLACAIREAGALGWKVIIRVD